MRATKEMLDAKVAILNRMDNREKGEQYFVGYENGSAHLFLEAGNGRATISYGNTKSELSQKLDCVINVLARREHR